MAPALSLRSPLRWIVDIMEPEGTQENHREKECEDNYEHNGIFSGSIQTTPLAHNVQRAL